MINMESPSDYPESPMDGEDVAYPCKGCGEILEEGKAFELAGNRWHLDCFRCNTCETLLDSDANLLLLGDGSLICNNCTYSCSACGNKIEDLAILTGDQAFCATCFRCRNCKRKIENLRYARTSQGIFCMSCHESLMARRRKKSKAAAQAKAKEKDTMLIDKSLPALPPNAVPQSAFTQGRHTPDSGDNDTPTELSPRPRPTFPQNDSSRSSSRRPHSPERSGTERSGGDASQREVLTLPTTTYRNNRHSAISQASDIIGPDGEGFFIPLALDPNPPPPAVTPRSASNTTRTEPANLTKENNASGKDYFNSPRPQPPRGDSKNVVREGGSQNSTPHIAFQEKDRSSSSDRVNATKDSPRLPAPASRSASATSSTGIRPDDIQRSLANAREPITNGKAQTSTDKFRLQEVPKRKRSEGSKSESQSDSPVSGGNNETSQKSGSGSLQAQHNWEMSGNVSRSDSPQRINTSDKSGTSQRYLSTEKSATPRSSQDSRLREEVESRASTESSTSIPQAPPDSRSPIAPKSIHRKEVGAHGTKNPIQSPGHDSMSSSASSSETGGLTPTVNGKIISGPVLQSPMNANDEHPIRPPPPKPTPSDTYMAPRAPPPPPPTTTTNHKLTKSQSGPIPNEPVSPKLPRWSSGGDFTMDEDMARILGTDEGAQSILRRVSNAVRHGRTNSEVSNGARHGHGRSVSETTRISASPRWSKTPIAEDDGAHRGISSPISISSPHTDDPAMLRRQLRNSEHRVAELERQFASESDLKAVNKKLLERRKTVSVLDSQAELMIRQIEVLAGYVEKAKDSKVPLDYQELEDSAIKDFVHKLERLKQSMSQQVEQLFDERNNLIEEKEQAVKDRDLALLEFEQLSTKNAQLIDMNNDLTTEIQNRFLSQKSANIQSPGAPNGLRIYNAHNDKASMHLDGSSIRSGDTTAYSTTTNNTYPHAMDQDSSMEPATVVSAPHVINIRKGQAKKFNWKKGATVAKGVSKGFKGAFSSGGQDRSQWQGQTGDSIGMPYNMTVAPAESVAAHMASNNSLPRSQSSDPRQGGGFGLFKKSQTMPKASSSGNISAIVAESPATLFGSELVDRAEYEKRSIPSVVTRCIEEVELRGMEVEGIYRKTGGSGLVKVIQEGFERSEDFDISDPDLDITAVTSVLKQYFRKLPTPLLTFDIYDRVLESLTIEDERERCLHLRQTFNSLPAKHRDCLEFLIFHLARVVSKMSTNLMTPKNIAVVFAPTIMRDTSLEREMTDMQVRNDAVQFVIENSYEIFSSS